MKYEMFIEMCSNVLKRWDLYSENVVILLAMICAHESAGGKYRRQLISENGKLVPKGKARGLFGMELETHDSIWRNSDTIRQRGAFHNIQNDFRKLEIDDIYAIWVARHYILMDRNPVPKTLDEMAQYCKKYWNRSGAATAEKYLNDYLAWKDGKI